LTLNLDSLYISVTFVFSLLFSGNVDFVQIYRSTPVAKIARRPVIYFAKASGPPLFNMIQDKLKSAMQEIDNQIISVYLQNNNVDEIFLPLVLKLNGPVGVYKLNVSEASCSSSFMSTDVTVEELETYDPLAHVYWSRAIIFRSSLIGERWEVSKVSVNPQLNGIQGERSSKRKRGK